MDTINFLLTTRVQGKNISTLEHVGNFFLIPVQYFWNGKKVDFIQDGNNKALQIDLIYQPVQFEEDSCEGFCDYLFVLARIVLFLPGLIIGAVCKGIAFCMYHDSKDDTFIKKCLAFKEYKGIVRSPKGQGAFGDEISAFIAILKTTQIWNAHLNKDPLFLSEIEDFRLMYVYHHPSARGGWTDQLDARAKDTNNKILDRVHLLWNLKQINVVDHFVHGMNHEKKKGLIALNPKVTFFDPETRRSIESTAKDILDGEVVD